jgi:hypothetical protein
VIPVEEWLPTARDLLDGWDIYRWQTLIAGLLALAAAGWAVRVTMSTAKHQIDAAREEADRMIAAAREQTSVTVEQTHMTVRLQRMRATSEAKAFNAMLEAAMARVLAEAAWARANYPQLLTETAGASADALLVRTCITKGAFAELRTACVRQGSPLTAEFLDLEREIDSFALQSGERLTDASLPIRVGKHAGLGEQLAVIEAKATGLRKKAAERVDQLNR